MKEPWLELEEKTFNSLFIKKKPLSLQPELICKIIINKYIER